MQYIKYKDRYVNVEKIRKIYVDTCQCGKRTWFTVSITVAEECNDYTERFGEYETAGAAQRAIEKFLALQEADIFEFED